MKKILSLIILVLLPLTSQAQSTDLSDAIAAVKEVSTTTLDDGTTILTDTDGITLYTFDIDENGESKCFSRCLNIWPVIATDDQVLADPFSVHVRQDGTGQIVFNGEPLYYFISDQNEGDIFGDGVNGVWHIVPVTL